MKNVKFMTIEELQSELDSCQIAHTKLIEESNNNDDFFDSVQDASMMILERMLDVANEISRRKRIDRILNTIKNLFKKKDSSN